MELIKNTVEYNNQVRRDLGKEEDGRCIECGINPETLRQDTLNEVLEKIDSWIESSKQFDKEWNKGYLAAMEQIRFELESEKEE